MEINELLEGCYQRFCENCNVSITTNRKIVCPLDEDAQFCSELCEKEHEISIRESWLGDTNESAIFSTNNC